MNEENLIKIKITHYPSKIFQGFAIIIVDNDVMDSFLRSTLNFECSFTSSFPLHKLLPEVVALFPKSLRVSQNLGVDVQ